MFSKKEAFLNELQYKIGDRFNDLDDRELNTANDIVDVLIERNQKVNWPFLNFLPLYFNIKSKLEPIANQSVNMTYNLNDLTRIERLELKHQIESDYQQSFELRRPVFLRQLVFLFPLFSVLGSLLISTYLVTSKGSSGWVYLSALVGIILSLALFSVTNQFKTKFNPENIVDFTKSFFVLHHQHITDRPDRQMVETYVLEALASHYHQTFELTDTIPA